VVRSTGDGVGDTAVLGVFLVDDHEIVRRGIAGVIDAERDMRVVGESANARHTLGRVLATRPDVVVLDLRLPDGSGVDVCRDIRSAIPDARCIILTAFDDDDALSAVVMAGAAGYVLKDVRGQNLVDSIRRVARGESLISASSTRRVVDRFIPPAPMPGDTSVPAPDSGTSELTIRESQVLALIGEGLTNRQIGERLELAEKTVKNYVSGLLAKLGMERRTQAAIYATRGPRPPATED